MTIERRDLEHVARLARLKLEEKEIERFTPQISQIIKYMDQLNGLDTTRIEPTAHVLDLSNVFREDELRPSLERSDVLKKAPEATESHFRVPRIIET